jgi:hypothetical protein
MADELFMSQPGGNDLAPHGIRQRNVCAYIDAEPHIRPLRRRGAPRVYHKHFRAVVHPFQQMMKEDGVRLTGVGAPQQNYIGLLNFLV